MEPDARDNERQEQLLNLSGARRIWDEQERLYQEDLRRHRDEQQLKLVIVVVVLAIVFLELLLVWWVGRIPDWS